MPLTLAHPAATLPLKLFLGGRASFVALIVGSMAPDFVFFLPIPATYAETHSVPGLFWYCLPTGLALVLLFHFLLKEPAAALLPGPIARRVPARDLSSRPTISDVLRAAVCVPIGAATHVVWDSLTHRGGFLPERFDAMEIGLFGASGVTISAFRLLQHGSTAIGLLVIAVVLLRWIRRTPPTTEPLRFERVRRRRVAIWATLVLVPAIVSIYAGRTLGAPPGSADWLSASGALFLWEFAGIVFITGGQVLFVCLSTYALTCWTRLSLANG